MPELSIITINLNNAEGLKRTMQSVLLQTFKDYEYIVIDGGSTDESVKIIDTYKDKLTKWVSEKDSGIYNAMNKGIRFATGKYCLFLNSGDSLIDENIISKVFNGNPQEDILYGELIFNFGEGKKEVARLPKKLDLIHLYNDNIWHPAAFIKRKLLDDTSGYNEKYKIAGDYDFFFNVIAIKQVSCAYLPYPIAIYDTKGISSISENMPQILAERAMIHKSYLNEKEIAFLNNLKKYRKPGLSKWLVGRPVATRVVDLFWRLLKKSKLIA